MKKNMISSIFSNQDSKVTDMNTQIHMQNNSNQPIVVNSNDNLSHKIRKRVNSIIQIFSLWVLFPAVLGSLTDFH